MKYPIAVLLLLTVTVASKAQLNEHNLEAYARKLSTRSEMLLQQDNIGQQLQPVYTAFLRQVLTYRADRLGLMNKWILVRTHRQAHRKIRTLLHGHSKIIYTRLFRKTGNIFLL